MQDSQIPEVIVHAIYKELKSGDFRKGIADSNDTKSGGGARDLRFGGYDAFKDMFRAFLPGRRVVNRRRAGLPVQLEILTGQANWISPNIAGKSQPEAMRTLKFAVEFEEPTTARPTEGRLTRVHEYPFFGRDDYLPAHDKSRRFLLITQSASGLVYFHIVSENILRQPDPDNIYPFNRVMIECIDAERNRGVAVLGHYNFANGENYCNAR